MMAGTRRLWLQLLVSLIISCLLCINIATYVPPDYYLIDCGSLTNNIIDSREFLADTGSSWTLSALQTTTANTSSPSLTSDDGSILYKTARIFNRVSSYIFLIKRKGRHFIRLHFFAFGYNTFDLSMANFSVSTQEVTLLSNFRASRKSIVFKEYLVNVTSDMLIISFLPTMNSIAFVNAIEVVSVPDNLIGDSARSMTSTDPYPGLSGMVLESVYRINMGGPKVLPSNDTLGRTWIPDVNYLVNRNATQTFTSSGVLNWIPGGATNETAPATVYKSLVEMANVNVTSPDFNISWEFPVDRSFTYLVRMHFCDVVSSQGDKLLFNAYIGSSYAARDLDLTQVNSNKLAAPYYVDYVTQVTDESGKLCIRIGPTTSVTTYATDRNAILNGLEVLKIDSSLGKVHDRSISVVTSSSSTSLILILGIVFGVTALVLLAAIIFIVLRRRKIVKKEQSRTSIAGTSHTTFGSKHSNGTGLSTASRDISLQFYIPFADLRDATNKFNQDWVIGTGGFGKVYRGVLRDNTMVAVKRANPNSQQGFNEFRTEIELLSQLRHRHLVSLIGYCNERNEMILVYEYMENGSLKGHLYGSDEPSLTWKRRLQICIEAARGLHYLHTGVAKAIIHRDVKSANILLDENFVAKVADFGLSTTGPDIGKTHVTTFVKGSYGYLDPEYFRRQKLTEKSDVYSFGMVLLEVLCARPVIDPSLPTHKINLAEWVMKWMGKGNLDHIVDARLGTIWPPSLEKFVETAVHCLMEEGANRPSMGDVLWNLEFVSQLEESLSSSSKSNLGGNSTTTATTTSNTNTRITKLQSQVQKTRVKNNTGIHEVGESQEQGNFSNAAMSKVFSQLMNPKGR